MALRSQPEGLTAKPGIMIFHLYWTDAEIFFCGAEITMTQTVLDGPGGNPCGQESRSICVTQSVRSNGNI